MSVRGVAIIAPGEAVKFDAEGCDFYRRVAEEARDSLAQAGFKALAEDGKELVRRVREICEELKGKPGWLAVSAGVARASWVPGASDATAEDALLAAAPLEREGVGC